MVADREVTGIADHVVRSEHLGHPRQLPGPEYVPVAQVRRQQQRLGGRMGRRGHGVPQRVRAPQVQRRGLGRQARGRPPHATPGGAAHHEYTERGSHGRTARTDWFTRRRGAPVPSPPAVRALPARRCTGRAFAASGSSVGRDRGGHDRGDWGRGYWGGGCFFSCFAAGAFRGVRLGWDARGLRIHLPLAFPSEPATGGRVRRGFWTPSEISSNITSSRPCTQMTITRNKWKNRYITRK